MRRLRLRASNNIRYQTPLEVVQALTPFIKQGATPKSSPELSSGPLESKPVIKKIAPVDPPPPPLAKPAKTQPESADVWGALTDDNVTSAAPRKSPVIHKRRAAPVRERSGQSKWLIGGIMGAGMILMLLLGMWLRGVVPEKPPDGNKELQEEKPAKLPDSITNSVGMKLVLGKPGTFDMGSPPNEEDHSDNEKLHTVEITQSFYVGVYEVTQAQYQQVMGNNPSWFSSTGEGKDKVQGMDTRQFPVEMVSWDDAVKFCHKLSDRSKEKANGRRYRLPTEAEWEYICRGGHLYKNPSLPFHFGNSPSSSQANFDGNHPYGDAPKGPYLQRTAKVGSYHPSNHPLDLEDLHGNVWEWCHDWYDEGYYKRCPRQDPQGPENGEHRVLRGGSWYSSGSNCCSASRNFVAPGNRDYFIGFRVVFVLAART